MAIQGVQVDGATKESSEIIKERTTVIDCLRDKNMCFMSWKLKLVILEIISTCNMDVCHTSSQMSSLMIIQVVNKPSG